MVLLMTFTVIGFVFGYFLFRKDRIEAGLAASFFCIISACTSVMLLCAIGYFLPKKEVLLGKINLANLRDVDGVSGSFFLGSGTVGSRNYYFFYQKNNDGGLKPNKLMADNRVVIYEDEESAPHLNIFETAFSNPNHYYWAIMAELDRHSRYEFHIPQGSLRQNFVLH